MPSQAPTNQSTLQHVLDILSLVDLKETFSHPIKFYFVSKQNKKVLCLLSQNEQVYQQGRYVALDQKSIKRTKKGLKKGKLLKIGKKILKKGKCHSRKCSKKKFTQKRTEKVILLKEVLKK